MMLKRTHIYVCGALFSKVKINYVTERIRNKKVFVECTRSAREDLKCELNMNV